MTAGILGGIIAGLAGPDWARYLGLVPLLLGAVLAWRARRERWPRLVPWLLLVVVGLVILVLG
ncbi:hypothetical protein [Kutzneria kofuensis]|uniref:Heme A synthase n=1 Tax=Kutzneria kofuensis TaxID=103725 RepID=A0A7W9NED6_9PSEU|nr:hypothetical protein [Kutzneria kofuensis]MBB5889299.1 heme A synthase [Kutzneria kofuensis]